MRTVLFINALDSRYGSTYRARDISRVLRNAGLRCIYVESNGSDSSDDEDSLSVRQTDTVAGYIVATLARARLALITSYDILLVQKFTPLTLPAIIAGRLLMRPIIVDWDDLDAEFQRTMLRRCLAAASERIGIILASSVTVHNPYLERKARAMGCANVWYVPQPVDTGLFDPGLFDHELQKKNFGLEGRLVIGYIGTLTGGGIRDIDAILQWIRDTRDLAPYHFLITGGGPQEYKLRSLLARYGITDFTITGMLRHEQMPQYIAAMDVCTVFMRDNPGNQARVSLKVLEALCMLRPVVGVAVGLTQNKFKSSILPFDRFRDTKKKEYAGSLLNARSLILQEHSLEAVETRMREVFGKYA